MIVQISGEGNLISILMHLFLLFIFSIIFFTSSIKLILYINIRQNSEFNEKIEFKNVIMTSFLCSVIIEIGIFIGVDIGSIIGLIICGVIIKWRHKIGYEDTIGVLVLVMFGFIIMYLILIGIGYHFYYIWDFF